MTFVGWDGMKYRLLGRTGLKVSELGFGDHEYRRPLPTTLGRWGEIDIEEFTWKQPERNGLIKRAVEGGVNFFDNTGGYSERFEDFKLLEVWTGTLVFS